MKPHRLSRAVISQFCFAAILFIAPFLNVQAQTWTQYDQGTPPQHAAGVSPLGSYLSTDLGTVNLSNGSLNLSLPMGTAGGRGFSIPISLNYSSKVWSVAHDTAYWPPPHDMDVDMAYARYAADDTYEDIFNRVAPGWVISGMPLLKRQGGSFPGCQSYSLYAQQKLTVVLPDKGEIELRDDLNDGAPIYLGCAPNPEYRGRRWHATDGSGIVFISDNDNGVVNSDLAGTLITGDGMRYRFVTIGGILGRATSVTDRNGNQITINYSTDQTGKITTEFVDQLGRSTKVEQNAPDPANGSVILALLVTIKGYQGTPQYYKVKTEALGNHIRSDFNYNQQPILTGYNDRFGYCYQGGQPPAANYLFPDSYCQYQERIDTKGNVSQIILPDGRSLQFSYNLYGEVAEVTLPTGGKLQYDYTSFTGTGFPSGNTLPGEYQGQMNAVNNIDRAVTARRTYPDGTTLEQTSTYLFGPQVVNGSSSACTEVKAYADTPTGGTLLSDQRHFFLPAGRYLTGSHGSMSGTGYSLWSTGVEWRTEVLDAAGAVISASEQDWSQRTPVSWSSGYTQEQPANDNRVSEARRYLDDGSFAKTDTFYDNANYPRANNVSEVKEYGFDQSLKRRTTMSYVTGSYQTDDAIHLVRLVQQQSIYDGSGTNEVARAVNEYDVYAADGNHAPLQDYGAVVGHDSAYGLSKVTRGNLTATGRWLKNNNTTIYSYLRYDTLGNPVSNKDANGNVTTLTYADDFGDGSNPDAGSSGTFGATFALPTLITSPPPTPGAPVHTARTQYDFWSGLLTGFKDRNGVITQTIYNDPFSRPTMVKTALGISGVETHAAMYYAPTTAFGITLTNSDVLTAKDQTTLSDATLRSWTHTDGFGRTVETWSRDPQGDDKVSTVYDALGRVRQQSNPFRPSLGEIAIYTTTVYDLAGRVTSVTTPDSAVVSTYYRGNQVLVKDQMSKERMSQTNALGQLTDVWEITGADDSTESVSFPNHAEVAAGYRTKYTYDTLGNLTTVTQQKGTAGTTQTRSFVYNSLSQLTDATNPESGHIVYDYDPNGNLLHKIDARPVTTTYAYDALNRNTTIDYSDTTTINPDITRFYDGATNGKGRFWYSYAGGTFTAGNTVETTAIDSFDALGNPLIQRQLFKTNGSWSSTFQTQRTYSLAGAVTSQTYPSGHTVAYAYDTAGRSSSFTGNLGDGTQRSYSTEIIYSPLGGMTKEKYGTDTALYNKLFYNSRGQLSEIREGTYNETDGTWWNRGAIINHYSDGCWGSCGGSNSTTPMTDNNGNLKKQEVYIPNNEQITSYTTWWQQYDYDALNRLNWVREIANGAELWKQALTYDRYGNRTIHQTNTWGTGVNKKDFTVNTGNNRLGVPAGQTGTMAYDNAGNLTTDSYSQATYAGSGSRVYDGENRMTSAEDANGVWSYYTYNADGQRVRRKVNGVETWQVYGFAGELLAEYAANAAPASPQKEYGYRNGQLLITADVTTGPPLPTFSDDFNDNSLDTAKWSIVDPNSPAVVGETGQRLQITLPPNTAAYNGISSNSTFDLTGKSVQVEVAQTVSQAGWCENFIQVVLDANNYYLIDVGAGSMVFRSMTGGVNNQTVISYDPNAFPYWRIRHDQAANTINLETSNNGTSWTTRKTVTPGFSLTALRFYLYAGAWGTGNGSPGAAKYDNFQLVGNTPSTVVNLNWLVTDQLGTPRMVFDKTGALATVKRHDYLPFGEEIFAGTGGRSTTQGYPTSPNSNDGVRQKFTLKERDNETGLDYFVNRYYSSSQGRFTSADPIPMTSQRPPDPQRLNLYSYVRNNPLIYTDPNGLELYFELEFDSKGKVKNWSDAKQYKKALEKGTGLKLDIDKTTGKVTIKSQPTSLSTAGAQIKTIINDTANTPVRIGASNNDVGVLGGRFNGGGSQTLDFADISKLSKKNGFSKESIVVHETTEAYEGIIHPTGTPNQFHSTAIGFENDVRAQQGRGARIGESGAQSGSDVVISVDFTTHIERITVDPARPGDIKKVEVVKKTP